MANIINVDNKHHHVKHRKMVFLFIAVVLVLGAVAGYAYTQPGLIDKLLGRHQSLQTQVDKATALANQGKKDQAIAVLQQYITSTNNPQDKRDAYLQQSILLTGQPQIDALIKADQIAPRAATEGTIAQKAEQVGNKTVAIAYYQKAVANANDGSDMPDSIAFYKSRLKELTNAQ